MLTHRASWKPVAVYAACVVAAVLTGMGVAHNKAIVLPAVAAAALLLVVLLVDSAALDLCIFLALFSGPPRLRARDPLASLRGEIDWVVVLHVIVWAAGALWTFRQLRIHLASDHRSGGLSWPHRAALALVVVLGLSTIVSPGRMLTLFRTFQVLVAVLFSFLWVEKYGTAKTLHHLFLGYVILAVSLAAAAIVSPDLVLAGQRIRGDVIANTGVVGAMGLILLLTYAPRLHRGAFAALLVLFVLLLIFSRTRAAYVAVLLFMLLALLRLPRISAVRRFMLLVAVLVVGFLIFQVTPSVIQWVIRDPNTIATLSERVPWWRYLIPIMWQQSPYLGLGFYAAPRVYGLQYDITIGTAHNAFIEVLAGGGVLAGLLFAIIVAQALFRSARSFLVDGRSPEVFSLFVLLLTTLAIGMVSEEMIIASPTALTFWLLVSLIQRLHRGPGAVEAREIGDGGGQCAS